MIAIKTQRTSNVKCIKEITMRQFPIHEADREEGDEFRGFLGFPY
jgi:hypothetical protein